MKFFLYEQKLFLSRRRIPSATLLHEQLIHLTSHPACHNIANGIKPESDPKKTDKHAADYSNVVCWGVKGLCEMYKIVHTTMWPKVSVFLVKQFWFIQEKKSCN